MDTEARKAFSTLTRGGLDALDVPERIVLINSIVGTLSEEDCKLISVATLMKLCGPTLDYIFIKHKEEFYKASGYSGRIEIPIAEGEDIGIGDLVSLDDQGNAINALSDHGASIGIATGFSVHENEDPDQVIVDTRGS